MNKLIEKLNSIAGAGDRVRLFYGKDGRVWSEENEVTGRVGRSSGKEKILLLCSNSRSKWGGSILTDCLIGLKVNGVFFGFKRGYGLRYEVIPITDEELLSAGYTYSSVINGELHGNFRTKQQAIANGRFMTGLSDSKSGKSGVVSEVVDLSSFYFD